MTVYIDTLYLPATIGGHTSRWCKLTADSTEELKAFATGQLKLRERYIQNEGGLGEHYALTEPKRLLAIKHGAQEIPHTLQAVPEEFKNVSFTATDLQPLNNHTE